jgi:hypothetical protein
MSEPSTSKPKRRLPVLGSAPPPSDDEVPPEERPGWHWVPLGAATALLLWTLLLALAQLVVRALHARPEAPLAMVANLVAIGLGSAAAGALTGRFGPRAGRKHVALGSLMATGTALAFASIGGSFPSAILLASLLLLGLVATLSALVGHRLATRRGR